MRKTNQEDATATCEFLKAEKMYFAGEEEQYRSIDFTCPYGTYKKERLDKDSDEAYYLKSFKGKIIPESEPHFPKPSTNARDKIAVLVNKGSAAPEFLVHSDYESHMEGRRAIIKYFAVDFINHHKLGVEQITCCDHVTSTEDGKHVNNFIIVVELDGPRNFTFYPGSFIIPGNVTRFYYAPLLINKFGGIKINNYLNSKKESELSHWDMTKKMVRIFVEKGKSKEGVPQYVENYFGSLIASRGQPQCVIERYTEKNMPQFLINNSSTFKKFLAENANQGESDFKWTLPRYLLEGSEDPILNNIYSDIAKWYTEECISQNPDPTQDTRRKALVILGDRGCGKSYFARNLVSDPAYYVKFGGGFIDSALDGKKPRLLILDDMPGPDAKNIECWKSLLAGETTNIQGKYCNLAWNHKVPCIVLTNNESLFYQLSSGLFQTQTFRIYVPKNVYIGLPGSQPVNLLTDPSRELPDTMKLRREAYLNAVNRRTSYGNEFGGLYDTDISNQTNPTYGFLDHSQLIQKNEDLANKLHAALDKQKILENKLNEANRRFFNLNDAFSDLSLDPRYSDKIKSLSIVNPHRVFPPQGEVVGFDRFLEFYPSGKTNQKVETREGKTKKSDPEFASKKAEKKILITEKQRQAVTRLFQNNNIEEQIEEKIHPEVDLDDALSSFDNIETEVKINRY